MSPRREAPSVFAGELAARCMDFLAEEASAETARCALVAVWTCEGGLYWSVEPPTDSTDDVTLASLAEGLATMREAEGQEIREAEVAG